MLSGPTVDLNCDMGEGMTTDGAIYPLISSANIACGGHAGDSDTMRRAVDAALRHGVAIGAHPSYPDRAGFGRTELPHLRLNELPEILTAQLEELQAVCREFGTALHHVKPHGALYNRAARDPVVGEIICRVIAGFDPSLLLYGLSGSGLKRQAQDWGLVFVSEVFSDRTYQADGSLTSRTEPNALIKDPAVMMQQVLMMLKERRVRTMDGIAVPIAANTICLHGDGAHAVEFARTIREGLDQNGITIGMPARL
jgi:5-oxoprolinase (ATP-hydrolysing) subunit A